MAYVIPTSGWNGNAAVPNSVHVVMKGSNAAGTLTLGGLAGDPLGAASTAHGQIGLMQIVNCSPEVSSIKIKAENSLASIKNIMGSRDVSYEIEALIPTNLALSLANGVMGLYSSTITVSGKPESIYADVVIYYPVDETDILSATCTYHKAIRMRKCLVVPMMGATTLDGQGREVCKFRLEAAVDETYGLYQVLPTGTIDATAEYITVT